MTYTDHDGADRVRSCTRKKGYPEERFARIAITSIMAANPRASVRAYACRYCGLWHVGAVPRSEGDPGLPVDAAARLRPRRRREDGASYSRPTRRPKGSRRLTEEDR